MPSPQAQDAIMRVIFFVVIMLYLSTNNGGPVNYANIPQGPSGIPIMTPREAFDASLLRQRHALSVLRDTQFGSWKYDVFNGSLKADPNAAALNLTGFREVDGYAWDMFKNVTDRVRAMKEHVWTFEGQKAVYDNVTSQLRGQWVRSVVEQQDRARALNLTAIAPHISWSADNFNRNITGSGGALELVMREQETEHDNVTGGVKNVREIKAHLTIEDESHFGSGWQINLHGVHWPEEGEIVMTTSSDKFAGIYGLPHLSLSQSRYDSSQILFNRTLTEALQDREAADWGLPADPYISTDEVFIPRCEYVVFAQVHPVLVSQIYKSPVHQANEDLAAELEALERELAYPKGAPVIRPPPIKMTMLVFSPDCGFILESKGPPDYIPVEGQHLQGLKREVYVRHIKRWCLIWAIVLLAQVALLRQQMRETSTPSTIGRISLYTTGVLAVADFIVVGVLMLAATSARALFPSATLTAFAGCISMGLGVRLMAEVYRVQEPERAEVNRARDIRVAEELIAFRARRDEYLARHRENRAAIEAAIAEQNAVPVITAAGVEMPGGYPPTSSPPTETSIPPPAPRVFPTPSPFTENLPQTIPEEPAIVPFDQDIDAGETATSRDTTLLPTTNPTAATPAQIAEASRQTRAQDIITSYGQFLLFLLIFFFVSISSSSWPTIIRKIYFHILAFAYFSFWIPQICRNASRNCRKALQWRFVFGQTILRIIPWCYFWLKTDNVLGVDQSLIGIGLIVTWTWCQILILVAQDVVGPRFALPKGYLPDAWDYHPLLREDDVEGAGLPLGLIRTSGSGSPTIERRASNASLLGNSKRRDNCCMSIDCAICMQVLEVPVLDSRLGSEEQYGDVTGLTGVAGLLARRLYMITPCRHAFHSKCLEGWMKWKLQCPICRENLPPL